MSPLDVVEQARALRARSRPPRRNRGGTAAPSRGARRPRPRALPLLPRTASLSTRPRRAGHAAHARQDRAGGPVGRDHLRPATPPRQLARASGGTAECRALPRQIPRDEHQRIERALGAVCLRRGRLGRLRRAVPARHRARRPTDVGAPGPARRGRGRQRSPARERAGRDDLRRARARRVQTAAGHAPAGADRRRPQRLPARCAARLRLLRGAARGRAARRTPADRTPARDQRKRAAHRGHGPPRRSRVRARRVRLLLGHRRAVGGSMPGAHRLSPLRGARHRRECRRRQPARARRRAGRARAADEPRQPRPAADPLRDPRRRHHRPRALPVRAHAEAPQLPCTAAATTSCHCVA